MRLLLNEQDLIDSVCVFAAQRAGDPPQNWVAELFFNTEYGFSATAEGRNRYNRYQLNEQDLIDAVAIFVADEHRIDPQALEIELYFEEDRGFSAVVDRR